MSSPTSTSTPKFTSITQYDPVFTDLTHNRNQRGKNFCPFFALISAYRFLSPGPSAGTPARLSRQQHELNVAKAVMAHTLHEIGEQMYFTDLLTFTPFHNGDVIATSVELIRHKINGYDTILPEQMPTPSAVIFLKNGKFFVVLVTRIDHQIRYFVRDCHEAVQYDELTRDALIDHLNRVYQFDHEIDLDGYKVEEYSNIEYLHVMAPFRLALDLTAKDAVVDAFEERVTDPSSDYYYNEFDEDAGGDAGDDAGGANKIIGNPL